MSFRLETGAPLEATCIVRLAMATKLLDDGEPAFDALSGALP